MYTTRTSSIPRRRALLLGFALLLTALGATQVAAGRRAATPPSPRLPMALVESVVSQTPTVSADGRWVVYAGVRELQVVGNTDSVAEVSTVWLKDRAAESQESLVELTPVRSDFRAGRTVWPVISGDGCTVTVITELALDVFRDDDTGDRWDVYRTLLPHCAGTSELGGWELISATRGSGFDVTASDDASPLYPPAVAADGNRVAYTHRFATAGGSQANSSADLLGITVVDLTIPLGDFGRAVPVGGTPATAPESTYRFRGQREPTMSADGNVVAFTSDAISDAVVPEWGIGLVEGGFATSNVYVWDVTPPAVPGLEQDGGLVDDGLDNGTGTVTAMSTVSTGATGDATSPALSGNGRFVAFVSTARNLIPGATLPPCGEVCLPQVYVRDRVGKLLVLASREPGDPLSPPIASDAGAIQPALNYGGDELLFVSRSTNLFPTRSLGVGDASDGDIVLALPALGTLDRVSVLADGLTPAPAANSHPRISAVGRVVVFDTLAGSVYSADGGASNSGSGRQVAIVEHSPTLSLSNLDFGTVAVWFPGPEWFLVLSNDGPTSFRPVIAEVDHEDFLVSGGTCLEVGVAVPAGETCTVELMLRPSQAGELKGTLTVSEEGFGAVSVTAHLTGRGGEPSLAPTPAGAYAGSQLVGTSSAPVSFTVANVSFGSVKVSSLAVEGLHPDDFQVSVDSCSGSTLGAGATNCEVQVVFTPTAGGRRSAQVVVGSRDGGYATMLLSGDAFYDPQLALANASSTIPAGSRLGVVGSGFAPNANVIISWADGSGGTTSVVADANGELNAQIVVRTTERSGQRTLVAQSLSQGFVPSRDSNQARVHVASVDVLVLSPSASRGPSSPAWPRP